MKKLAIVTSHPIQYNAPLFKLLAKSSQLQCKVFYTWEQSGQGGKYDPDFGKEIAWDIPLLEGYEYTFVKNTAATPGTHHFRGIINPGLNEELSQWKPDAILVFGWSFESHFRCIRHFHGKIPVLFRGDSTLLDEQPGLKRQLRRLFLKWVYGYVDYALYTGTNNKEYFAKHGLRNDQLILAPHAIENERFAEPDELYKKKAAEWRVQLNIAQNDLVILFAGKLEPKKNPEFLIDLLKDLPGNDIKLIFTGNGILEESLKNKAGNDPRIRFIDFQNQSVMPVIYRIADIFILPSRGPGETWGLGANEAMASGCVVMLSDKTGGAIDLVKEGENGIIFKLTEMEKCRTFIGQVLHDRKKLAEMKRASGDHIRDFSYPRIVRAIEEIMLKEHHAEEHHAERTSR
jgi:glycosyltransferase involved in cell wall biosynthesis